MGNRALGHLFLSVLSIFWRRQNMFHYKILKKVGVASSLNYIPLEPLNKTAALTPYPDWKANTLPEGDNKIEADSIVSVFRVRVDDCDRLWVMDTGVADIWGDTKVISKPALVIFDLKTDKLIRRYEFKPTDLKEDSFFANVVVDVTPGKCNEAYAYVPDLGGYGVVVYSFAENDSWRVCLNSLPSKLPLSVKILKI